jgi:AraC family transcriptional regulator
VSRKTLISSSSGLVENVADPASRRGLGAEDFSPDFQLSFPYRGVFIWHVGRDEVVGDPNQILFVTGGEAFRLSTPRSEGFCELIITPKPSVLREMSEATGFDLSNHPSFQARCRMTTPTIQRACAALLRETDTQAATEALEAEEQLLGLLRAALAVELATKMPSMRTRRLIRRTKEFLESAFSDSLRLGDVADAVGASSTYLTDVFSRFEGVSLHRYVTQLRLARALVELPEAGDLTSLALDLGFSSHSHFTLAFRRAFGCTPSTFRARSNRNRAGAMLASVRPARGDGALAANVAASQGGS